MAITIRIPQPLRPLTGNQSTVPGVAGTLRSCLDHLEKAHPGIKERLMDETGQLRRFVNVYVNGEDVRFIEGMGTPVNDGDEISIVPAVAGGQVGPFD